MIYVITEIVHPTTLVKQIFHKNDLIKKCLIGFCSYETDHGIKVDVQGYLKNPGTENEAQVIQGSYSYYAPDGTPILVTYTADENGYVAQGDHLPQPSPAIAKALEYQRSLPPSQNDEKKKWINRLSATFTKKLLQWNV